MDVTTYFLLGLLMLALGYFVILYNNLVALKHRVGKAWANIDVLMKQRHDELPKLVDTCKQYMQYEQDTLERVVRARNAVSAARADHDVPKLDTAENELRSGLGSLFALAESYPDLKADTSFQNLQARISELENAIADRREFYNEAVNRNNIRIEQFPDVLVARLFHFSSHPLLRFETSDLADVDVKALFR